MPQSKLTRKGGGGLVTSAEPGCSKRDKHNHSSDEDDDPGPRKNLELKSPKLGQLSKKVSSASKQAGTHTSCHNKPAELFRKDLISAMKLPDTEILYDSEYVIISDPWRQEWEMGVQVPINEESKTVTCVSLKKDAVADFKLPPRKLLHNRQDETYIPAQHDITGMEEMAERIVRYDLDDQDVQWLTLVNEDREEMGLQLINEWNMERMIEELENQCYKKTNDLKKTEEGLGIEYDEDIACDVCRLLESEDTNEMVFCDGCDVCVHQACYGIQNIPEGDWLCRICALGIKPMCLLCPKRGGAMKPTKSGTKWTHVSCALWIPEVSIGCPEKMEPVTKISNIPHSRWALVCCLCKERVGACIQCSVKTCKTAFHVTCGFAHNLDMRTIVDETDDVDGIHLRAYCPKHTKNRNASDSDSPKKGEESQEEEYDIENEAEMTKIRMEKLTELEEQFYTLVDITEVARKFYIPEEAVDIVAEYWKLKRKMNNNKQLITVKMEEEDQMQRQQKDSLAARMKLFVHLRQDLERARNLCCMISKREKTKRQLFNLKEEVFRAQLNILTDLNLQLGAKEAERVRRASRFDSIYCDLSNKSSNSKVSLDNVFSIEDIKTPKDHEEEKEKERDNKKALLKAQAKPSSKKNASEAKTPIATIQKRKSSHGKGEGKRTVKVSSDDVKAEKSDQDNVPEDNKAEDVSEVKVDTVEVLANSSSPQNQEDKESVEKVKEEVELKVKADESSQDSSAVVECDSPSKKHLIPCDLKKKLTSLLQSKTIKQQQQDKSGPATESAHINVETSDCEAPSPEANTEVAAPSEGRMNLFDQFTVDTATKPSDKAKEKAREAPSSSELAVKVEAESDLVVYTNIPENSLQSPLNSPGGDGEQSLKHSSHKKSKRRKHSRTSHKHKRVRSSLSPQSENDGRLSVSPIIIKTEGDSVVSKQVVVSSKQESRSHRHSSSPHKSDRSSKKKRSHRDRNKDSDEGSSSERNSSPCKAARVGIQNSSDSTPQEINDAKSQEESQGSETKVRIGSKLRLKKQASPVKGVVSYEVVNIDKEEEDRQKTVNDESRVKTEGKRTIAKNIFDQVQEHSSQSQCCSEDTISNSGSVQSKSMVESATGAKSCELNCEGKEKEISDGKREKGDKNNKRISKQDLKMCNLQENDLEIISDDMEPAVEGKRANLRRRSVQASSGNHRERRRTRSGLINEDQPGSVDDSSDENFKPNNPVILPRKTSRPKRSRTRCQLHPDETDGEDGEEEDNNSDEKEITEEDEFEKKKGPVSKKGNTAPYQKNFKLKSPLPDKPELNKLLLDPSKLLVKDSLRRRVGDRLAMVMKGRNRRSTIRPGNQPTLDKFLKRTTSCENVFSKVNDIHYSHAKRLSLQHARSDLSPLSVNTTTSFNKSEADSIEEDNILNSSQRLGSPLKEPPAVFGARSPTLRSGLHGYRSSRLSTAVGRLKEINSVAVDSTNSQQPLSSSCDTLFGDADKLQRPGLRRQLSFDSVEESENPVSRLRGNNSVDMSEIVKTPSKCNSSELTEDHLDGSHSYRSPSPVSSITSIASSRLGRQRGGGKGLDGDSDKEEVTPSKRLTRSRVQEESSAESPSSRLRSREGSIIKPPKLTLS